MSNSLQNSVTQIQRDDYLRELDAAHRSLGITRAMLRTDVQPIYLEHCSIDWKGIDLSSREFALTKRTGAAWELMRTEASQAGIELIAVSGFRSVQYQHDIIRKKLNRGMTLEGILRVNAVPGFSQHHTGCALDLTDGFEPESPLEERFADRPAFHWLVAHSSRYGFRLEYPRENQQGFIYEPWHWVHEEVDEHVLSPSL